MKISMWRVVRDISIAILLAVVVSIAFFALSRFGGASGTAAYLGPGRALSNALPPSWTSWLDPIPEITQGNIAASVLAFLCWWLLLMAITFGVRTYVRRRT
jgi:hypothetical protein